MKMHVSSISIFCAGILNKPQATGSNKLSSWNTKVLHTRGEGAVLVSKKIFVLLCKVAATESSFIKPTRLSSKKMIPNLF